MTTDPNERVRQRVVERLDTLIGAVLERLSGDWGIRTSNVEMLAASVNVAHHISEKPELLTEPKIYNKIHGLFTMNEENGRRFEETVGRVFTEYFKNADPQILADVITIFMKSAARNHQGDTVVDVQQEFARRALQHKPQAAAMLQKQEKIDAVTGEHMLILKEYDAIVKEAIKGYGTPLPSIPARKIPIRYDGLDL